MVINAIDTPSAPAGLLDRRMTWTISAAIDKSDAPPSVLTLLRTRRRNILALSGPYAHAMSNCHVQLRLESRGARAGPNETTSVPLLNRVFDMPSAQKEV